MSDRIVQIDGLSDAIKDELDKMNHKVIEGVNKAAEKAARDAVSELKSSSPVRSDGVKRKVAPGSYAKSWTKKAEENAGIKNYTVYNSKYYMLTHLLEFGHIVAKTGGRTVARPHIADANENAANEFMQEVEQIEF